MSDKNDKKVIFPGDNIFPRNEIINHWIPLILNPVEYMDSLEVFPVWEGLCPELAFYLCLKIWGMK